MNANEFAGNEPWCCALSSGEIEFLRNVFQSILTLGRTPSLEEMRSALGKSDDEIVRVLDELEEKDVLVRRRGTQEIVSIYPLSLTPTEHQIVLDDGMKLFAMCAVDALGMPVMFNRAVKVVSQCERCREEVTVEIKNDEIASVSHPDVMIWNTSRGTAPAAESCCPLVNFFCCREHLNEWAEENRDLIGETIEIKKGFPRIKQRWRLYGETLGFR